MRYIGAVFVLILLVISLSSISYASPNVYFVAKTGNDSTGDGSLSNPWLTISHGIQSLAAGETLYIRGGNYHEGDLNFASSGTSSGYIKVQNYNMETVNIDSRGSWNGFDTAGCDYLKIIGLGINSPDRAGIEISGGSEHILVQNCRFAGSGVGGIYMAGTYQSKDINIDNNNFNQTNTLEDMEVISLRNVDQFTITNNIVSNSSASQRVGIDMAEGCKNGLVAHNNVYNVTLAGIYIDARGNSSNITIDGNDVHNNAGAGIQLGDENHSSTVTNINIYNNLIYRNQRGFQVDGYGTETFQFNFVNNTMYENGYLTEIYFAADYLHFPSALLENNILYGKTGIVQLIEYSDYSHGTVLIDHNLYYSGTGVCGGSVFGTNYIQSDPIFKTPGIDYRLSAGSPAVGAGVSSGSPSTDITGAARAGAIDIGAYQYNSGYKPPTPSSTPTSIVPPNVPTTTPIVPSGISSWGLMFFGVVLVAVFALIAGGFKKRV